MKFKKIITSMPLLYTALSATLGAVGGYAGTMGDMVNEPQPFTGWYLGAEGGILSTINNLNQNTYYLAIFGDGGYQTSADDNFSQTSKYGTGFFSVGLSDIYNEKLYFGAEAGVSIANKSNSYYDVNNSLVQDILIDTRYAGSYANSANYIKSKLNYAEFDVDFKVGALLSQATLFYGRVGLAVNHQYYNNYFSVDNILTRTDTNPPVIYGYSGSSYINSGKNILGLRLGLGIEQSILKNISLKLDYIATLYQAGKIHGYGTLYPDTNAASIGFQLNLDNIHNIINSNLITHSVMLGVNVYLDDMFN